MHPLLTKSLIGLILIIVAFYSLLWNNPVLLLVEVIGIGIRGIYELVHLVSKKNNEIFIVLSLFSVAIVIFLYRICCMIPFEKFLLLNLAILVLGVTGIFLLFKGKKVGLFLAHFWISVPLFSIWMGHKYWVQCSDKEFILNPLCLFIGTISAGDSLAMFVGKLSKNKKFIFPTISPNKTLQGTVGYFVGTTLFALGWCRWTQMPLNLGFGIAVLAFVFGLAGDLLESRLKRKFQTKDTGNIIPGHGGVLDRFDSIFLAILPCMIYYVYICF